MTLAFIEGEESIDSSVVTPGISWQQFVLVLRRGRGNDYFLFLPITDCRKTCSLFFFASHLVMMSSCSLVVQNAWTQFLLMCVYFVLRSLSAMCFR